MVSKEYFDKYWRNVYVEKENVWHSGYKISYNGEKWMLVPCADGKYKLYHYSMMKQKKDNRYPDYHLQIKNPILIGEAMRYIISHNKKFHGKVY